MVSIYGQRILYPIHDPDLDCRCYLLKLHVDIAACPQHEWVED